MAFRKALAILLSTLALPAAAWSHCQIPCGIYDDAMRIQTLNEHITTIDKSMTQIVDLAADENKNYNHIVRWVNNKEHHANHFMEIVTGYYMAQRLKPTDKESADYADYQVKLELLHRMLVEAMKCKQTTNKAHVGNLRQLVKEFDAAYNKA